MGNLQSPLGKAIGDFNLIDQEDRILIGVSGGKDSLVLCSLLRNLQKKAPVKFSLSAVTVDPGEPYGFTEENLCAIKSFLAPLDIPHYTVKSHLARILVNYKTKKNTPCSLCANLRRGILYGFAKDHGFKKVALAHHLDDAIETLFLNMFYQSNFRTFSPKTYLSRRDITVIRPMVYISEEGIVKEQRRLDIGAVPPTCEFSGTTKRQEMKELITNLSHTVPGFRNNMKGVLTKTLWTSP